MDAEVALQIEQGELKGASKLVINNLEVGPGDPKRMDELTTQLNMPMDSALSLLRDKDNNIRLKLPVSGDVADPKFDLGDAINQAVGKAMRVTAVSYLKFYFQPFGAMITIGKWAGEAAASVHLDPVSFEAGAATLDDTAAQYFDRLAGLMQERPKLRVKLCGRAVPADRDTLEQAAAAAAARKAQEAKVKPPVQPPPPPPPISEEQLQALARQRATAAKDYLINRHGVAAERLFVCKPELDTAAEAKPRLELAI